MSARRVRSLRASVLSVLLPVLATSHLSAQAPVDTVVPSPAPGFTANPADFWYPFEGETSWWVAPNGAPIPAGPQPASRRPVAARPSSIDAAGAPNRTTSGTGWRAPVSPAEAWNQASGLGTSGMEPSRGYGPLRLEPQDPAYAESSCSKTATPLSGNASERYSPPARSWTETAANAVIAGTESIYGAWNWMRQESRELLQTTLEPLDRIALRPRCPECGKRHFRRR